MWQADDTSHFFQWQPPFPIIRSSVILFHPSIHPSEIWQYFYSYSLVHLVQFRFCNKVPTLLRFSFSFSHRLFVKQTKLFTNKQMLPSNRIEFRENLPNPFSWPQTIILKLQRIVILLSLLLLLCFWCSYQIRNFGEMLQHEWLLRQRVAYKTVPKIGPHNYINMKAKAKWNGFNQQQLDLMLL